MVNVKNVALQLNCFATFFFNSKFVIDYFGANL